MSTNRKQVKKIRIFLKQQTKKFLLAIKKQTIWLLRTFFVPKRRRATVNAGFVLPTVVMVALVVVLLTTAIMFRSFDRSKNASNVRVNEAVLNAAAPAIDRARAKLNKLFQPGGRLPLDTPNDAAIEGELENFINEYTFGDETQLKLTYGTETDLKTAWIYPVDTNNNGKFDSYTLYGIYFRNPPVDKGQYSRQRYPVEARTLPMITGSVSADCGDTLGTSASLVGNNGAWVNIGGKLKKSFFVYTANVPITNPPTGNNNYESYKGNKGFSSVEYQQDRVQLPLVNNAVIYEDDIALAPGTDFKLNGRIFTNSNFILGGVNNAAVTLYQVSSINSCFYQEDNAQIIIGGNLGGGGFTDGSDLGSATAHLYKGKGTSPDITPKINDNKSVNEVPKDIAYNSLAYVQRINRLVDAQIANDATGNNDPTEVKNGIKAEKNQLGLGTYTTDENEQIRRDQLQIYFKERTRRVPYKEVDFNVDALGDYAATKTKSPLQGSKADELRPVDPWIYPTDPSDGITATNYAVLALNTNGKKLLPSATEPTKLQKILHNNEQFLGDRALIGNNLPLMWWYGDKDNGKFVGPNPQDTQNITGYVWDDGDPSLTRTRRSRIQQLADLGATDRDKNWELAAAQVPTSPQDLVGGLRVVTGTGIYLPNKLTTTSTTANFTPASTLIWSDMMPIASKTATQANGTDIIDPNIVLPDATNTPFLRMRATTVYHYASDKYSATNPQPIACVSSYYNPTNKDRARNIKNLADVSPLGSPNDNTNDGSSNNGIVYDPPSKAISDYQAVLNYQASLKYPNGRLVNELLNTALGKTAANRTLSQQSAIDTALCALQILDGTIKVQKTPVIPHGAIMETAFLDARQIKAIHKDVSNPGVETFTNADGVNGDGTGTVANVPAIADYNLPIEQHQPLEIRATLLDLNALRTTKIGSGTVQEYLLPNSGIIYATRDDALLDLSAPKPSSGTVTQKAQQQQTESPVDFKLDPTRRPNAIMLINGAQIWRETNYRDAEKGLILASNLPVYIKGDFNLHKNADGNVEEFTDTLLDDWTNFYTRSTLNVNFACRPGDARLPKCTKGDYWRPASVLADAITLLSNNFTIGVRSDGDYDLNNNLGDGPSITAFQQNGFYTNAYVTNAAWYGSDDYPDPNKLSSYLNNFVTPIQRRGTFNEYLMEVCPKLPVSACQPSDWQVDPSLPSGQGNSWNYPSSIIGQLATNLKSGTTATPAGSAYQRYPRRVAFQRDSNGKLVLDSNNLPTPLGIDSNGKVAAFSYGGSSNPRQKADALWFKTTTNSNPTSDNDNSNDPVDTPLLLFNDSLSATQTSQPRLVPVLQINRPFKANQDTSDKVGPPNDQTPNPNWLQPATETTFNLAAAAGDTPARPTEDNGGLHNFVRFLENWNSTGDTTKAVKARISGSFIQFKRSAYATGPFGASLASNAYPVAGNSGTAPFYIAPSRQWGYDVGLLSQAPDLFAQKLVRTPDDLPDEFFREVSRDDLWVTTLLCSKKTDGTYAIDKDQRPTSCQ